MLQSTFLQPCPQPQCICVGPTKANHNPHNFKKHKSDSAASYVCLGRQQWKEKESSQRCQQQEGEKNCLSDPTEQAVKESARETFVKESKKINGDSSGLVSDSGYPVQRDSPKPASSDLSHSVLSNRGDQSQEWKVVKVKRVLISPVGEPRKTNISRSSSLSEKELKEAKARSQRIAAQLTRPPNSNSKGVLLFHKRKQRVNAFTQESPKTGREHLGAEDSSTAIIPNRIPSPGEKFHLKQILRDNNGELEELSCSKDSGLWEQKDSTEKHEDNQTIDKTNRSQKNELGSRKALSTMNTTFSSEEIPAADLQQIPLTVYLKEAREPGSTNGVCESITDELEKAPAADNRKNTPAIVDGKFCAPVTNRENNSTVLDEDAYILRTDKENNILDKEPTLPLIGTENNNNTDKEPYLPIIDRENNVVLDKALSEPVMERKENGEIVPKKQDAMFIENANIYPSENTEKSLLVTDSLPSEIKPYNNKHYCEVRLTLSKPKPVKNRTARPFGTQSLVTTQTSAEKSPSVEFPPPPTYAETFSSPPPVTRVRSPPAYSALYPNEEQKTPLSEEIKYEDSRPGPLPRENRSAPLMKTGILEESVGRRATKKSMFTFVEKPKVTPNPDLLNLVQKADIRRKHRGQTIPEDEPFALGAEASNFLPESTSRDGPTTQDPAGAVPEWSSCLRSPRIQPKPKIKSNQNLPEARGKGAELFARRQSRMQKYVVESPSHPNVHRSPSPTMSLPPSWKYASEIHLSPMTFQSPPKSPARSPKVAPVPLYNSAMTESEISKKELEITKQQPYQLQSSWFILSPAKDPVRSLPRGAPPPKPVVPEVSYMRQVSCPTSPSLSSPSFHPPAQSSPSRPLPGPFVSSSGAVLKPQNTRTAAAAPSEKPFEYSSRILSPRAKGVYQAPKPSYSTKDAGIEPQERRVSLPASPTWTPRLRRQTSSLDGWMSPAPISEPEEGLLEAFRAASITTPPPPRSPSWSERSLSPFRQELDPKSNRQMQVLLARNIINAARRKSSSPKAMGIESFMPFTPLATSVNASSSGGNSRSTGSPSPSPVQSPRPTRMDGYRPVSLPGNTAPPQVSASSNNSPRLLGRQSPNYKSPLQSPKEVRMNGKKYFTLPASTGALLFNAASNSGSKSTGNHLMAFRDPVRSPRPTIMDSHGIFMPPASTTRNSSCASPKDLETHSPIIKSPMPSPVVGAYSAVKQYTSRSPTNSDVSLDSEDSGIKSPSIRSFNICPRGWNGSLRMKRGSLPTEAPCTS